MAAYLVIQNGVVANATEWDGVSDWEPPEGASIALAPSGVGIGWKWNGTTFSPPPPPAPAVPDSVTNYQARTALINSGQFAQVDQAIHASNNQLAIQAWEYANVFNRTDRFISSFAAILGMTEAQIDQLFIMAAQVN